MNNKNIITITEGRKRLFDIAEKVQNPAQQYTLTDNGLPKVVLLSADEYESIMETLEVDRIFPNLKRDVISADKSIKTGQYKKWATLEDLRSNSAFVVADKTKNKYVIHSKNKTKGRKEDK